MEALLQFWDFHCQIIRSLQLRYIICYHTYLINDLNWHIDWQEGGNIL